MKGGAEGGVFWGLLGAAGVANIYVCEDDDLRTQRGWRGLTYGLNEQNGAKYFEDAGSIHSSIADYNPSRSVYVLGLSYTFSTQSYDF